MANIIYNLNLSQRQRLSRLTERTLSLGERMTRGRWRYANQLRDSHDMLMSKVQQSTTDHTIIMLMWVNTQHLPF